MLGLNHAKYLLGRGSQLHAKMSVNIKGFSSMTSKTSLKSVLANRKAFIRPQILSLACKPTTKAPFSTQLNGLRMLIETDLLDYDLRSAKTDAARLAFQTSNPFNDPKAHNCIIRFPPEKVVGFDDHHEDADGVFKADVERPYIYQKAKTVLRTELDRTVASAGHSTQWPIALRPYYSHPGIIPINRKSLDISFKLPSREDPEVFFSQLRAAGLTLGTCRVEEMKRKANNWWYRCLYLLPEKTSFLKGENGDDKVYKVGKYVKVRSLCTYFSSGKFRRKLRNFKKIR